MIIRKRKCPKSISQFCLKSKQLKRLYSFFPIILVNCMCPESVQSFGEIQLKTKPYRVNQVVGRFSGRICFPSICQARLIISLLPWALVRGSLTAGDFHRYCTSTAADLQSGQLNHQKPYHFGVVSYERRHWPEKQPV